MLPTGEGKWFRNIDYYRLDGSTNALTRKKWAEDFNDPANIRYTPPPAQAERSAANHTARHVHDTQPDS